MKETKSIKQFKEALEIIRENEMQKPTVDEMYEKDLKGELEKEVWEYDTRSYTENGYGGVKEEIVNKHEEELGVKFSPTLRYYLETYNGIMFNGNELYAIHCPNFDGEYYSDLYSANKMAQEEYNLNLKWINFYNLGNGETAAFDFEHINEEGEPRVIWHRYGELTDVEAESFGEFMYKFFAKPILEKNNE